MRNNPGGLLSVSVEVCDMFLNEGRVVSTRGRYKKEEEVFLSHLEKTIVDSKIPIVVLVNEGSASASEIFGSSFPTGFPYFIFS